MKLKMVLNDLKTLTPIWSNPSMKCSGLIDLQFPRVCNLGVRAKINPNVGAGSDFASTKNERGKTDNPSGKYIR